MASFAATKKLSIQIECEHLWSLRNAAMGTGTVIEIRFIMGHLTYGCQSTGDWLRSGRCIPNQNR